MLAVALGLIALALGAYGAGEAGVGGGGGSPARRKRDVGGRSGARPARAAGASHLRSAASAAPKKMAPTAALHGWIDGVATDGAHRPLLVQVGANDHANRNHDPAVRAVERGWDAVLLEPLPFLAEQLRRRYARHAGAASGAERRGERRIQVIQAALCGGCGEQSRLLHYFDRTRTDHHGSPTSDPRCAPDWLSELGSFSREHLLKHQARMAYAPRVCAACRGKLRSDLGDDCLSRVLVDNLGSRAVNCTCFDQVLPRGRDVALLLVDAEGHDYRVLSHFHFDRTAVEVVAWEPAHLRIRELRAARALLKKARFSELATDWALSVWRRQGNHTRA